MQVFECIFYMCWGKEGATSLTNKLLHVITRQGTVLVPAVLNFSKPGGIGAVKVHLQTLFQCV